MSTNNIETVPDEQLNLFDELQGLLEKQIKLARQGDIGSVERLTIEVSCVVDMIARAGILELDQWKDRREQLQELYEELCLAITAQQADIAEKLSRIRKGRKTIETYHSNI